VVSGFSRTTEHLEETDTLEDLLDPGCRLDDPKHALNGARHVVRTDQLADSGRVDSRHSRQIQDDVALAAPEERADAVPESAIHGRAKSPIEIEHALAVRTGCRDQLG